MVFGIMFIASLLFGKLNVERFGGYGVVEVIDFQ